MNDSTIVSDSVKRFKWVGTRPIRPDGVPKVTGRALYGADLKLPGMLYGKILRSPHAHARIKSIDTSAAGEEVFSERGLPMSLYTDRGAHYFTPESWRRDRSG